MKRSLDELKAQSHQKVVHDRIEKTDVLIIENFSMMEISEYRGRRCCIRV